MCRRGIASRTATEILMKLQDTDLRQISQIYNIDGGLNSLAKLDETLPLY